MDTPQFDGPEAIDRRKLLTAAAAMTAARTVPKVKCSPAGENIQQPADLTEVSFSYFPNPTRQGF